MLFCDVNVLVGAQRNDESPHSHQMRTWLEQALKGREVIGISELVLSATARIVTNARIFTTPSTPVQVITFAQALIDSPRTVTVRGGQRHWAIFAELVTEQRLRANDIPDAYLAALALEQGATMVTADRGFSRYGVRTLNPIDELPAA